MSRGLFDLHCSQCGRTMIDTQSGYISCPLGHGRLLAEAPAAAPTYSPSDLFNHDCDHCGRDVAAEVWELGGRHCGRCSDLLERNAKLAGVTNG